MSNLYMRRIRIGPYTEGVHLALSHECFVINVADPSENPYADVFVPLVIQHINSHSLLIPSFRLELVAHAIEQALRNQDKDVYVHCTAGLERSPLAVAWYLMTRYALSMDEAYAEIRETHTCWDRREWISFDSYEQRAASLKEMHG